AIRGLCQSHYSSVDREAWASAAMPDGFAGLVLTRDFLVAELDGAVVGFGFLNRETAELEALFVSPGVARRGIGKAILRSLERIAHDVGLTSLRLSASLNSVEFYAAVGYQATGEIFWNHPAGFRLACAGMAKRL
ncbi:MAG TPA: GNAT family N-acetyltransferase, partial [Pirellulales bacterium]|nr:GNAT family N-acetyltransferase [Pirellulales bacterium]